MQTIAEQAVAQKFRLARAPTLIARRDSGFPIGFSRLRSDDSNTHTTIAVPPEDVFSFLVALHPMEKSSLSVDGRVRRVDPIAPGETMLYDLSRTLVGVFPAPFDYLRFYLPTQTLDQLCHERGIRSIGGLRKPLERIRDPIMIGLAHTLCAALDRAGAVPALFTDSLSLAFHAHVVKAYGNGWTDPNDARRSPLPLHQLRRAYSFIEANLEGDPTIADLARECNLSPSHFARAFRQATGMPPYRWMLKRRVERAKELLEEGELELAEVALACGFVDQSHLTRNFTRFEGTSPGRWRKAFGKVLDHPVAQL